MELIDKDALVAEIKSLWKYYLDAQEFDFGWNQALDKVLSYLDTLEVKEVDLEKEIDNYFSNSVRKNLLANDNVTLFMQCRKVAKHFFELGIAESKKAQKGE